MSAPSVPRCPRCGSTQVTFCGKSVQYLAEEYPAQPMVERELTTLAYKCQCGLGFTETVSGPEK